MPTGRHPATRRIFGAPLRYIQGPGALSEVGPMAAALGSQALLVGDAFVLKMVGPDWSMTSSTACSRWSTCPATRMR